MEVTARCAAVLFLLLLSQGKSRCPRTSDFIKSYCLKKQKQFEVYSGFFVIMVAREPEYRLTTKSIS